MKNKITTSTLTSHATLLALLPISFILLLLININLIQAQFSGGYPTTFSGGAYRVYGSSVNPQFNNPSFLYSSGYTNPEIYWPRYNQDDCLERQDFIMQIAPGGCSPAVVTSDLLEEQNVPVFCKIQALQVNPLIDISRIRALRFRGQYPEGVSSVSYFPAKAAIQSGNTLISSPLKDNLGYVVIVLSKNRIEGEMPEFVQGNITAVIDYDAEGAFGIGTNNFYITELSDEEWQRDFKYYGFWNGKSYIRAESIEQIPSTTGEYYQDQAIISIYRDINSKVSTITLKKGETSRDIFLSGFYCAAGMNLRLDEIKTPVDTALIQITDNRNTKQIWVARGDNILDGKCWITDLDAYSGGGRIGINCRVQNGKFELSLNPGKASFKVDNQDQEFAIGDQIKPNLFLAYAGQDFNEKNFIILINDTFSESEQGFAERETYSVIEKIMEDSLPLNNTLKTRIENAIKSQYKKKLPSTSSNTINEKIQIKFLEIDETAYEIQLKEILIPKNKQWDTNNPSTLTAKQYYDEAIRHYEDLADLYPNEKTTDEQDYYAAQGLYEAARLSKDFQMNKKAHELFNKLLREYPTSDITIQALRGKELLTKYDTTNSRAVVYINNEAYFFDLLDVKKPRREDANAVFLINGQEITLGLEEIYSVEIAPDKKTTIQLKEIDNEKVIINYAKSEGELFGTNSKTKDLKLKEQTILDDISIKLLNINLKKQVRVTINPKRFGPRTESNFTFKIGIEKRAIQLTPEKTEELIDTTQEKISKWTEVNDKLGKVIKGLKGACFGTAAALTIKNLVEGFSGEAMARTKLMTASGGWNEFCENAVNNGEFPTVQKCLLDNNAQINKDIELYQKQIESTNKELEKIQKDIVGIDKTDILDLRGQTDAKKVEDEFTKTFNSFCNSASGSITLPDKDKTPVSFKDDICSYSTLTHEQKRELMTLYNAKKSAEQEGSHVLRTTIDNEIGKTALAAKDYWEYYGAEQLANKEAEYYGFKPTRLEGEKSALAEIYNVKSGDKIISSNSEIKPNDKVVRIFIPSTIPGETDYEATSEVANKYAIIKLQKEKDSGNYNLAKAYSLDGKTSIDITKDVEEYLRKQQVTSFKPANTEAYKNPMLHPGKLKVKYFERAPYKGLPAEVPFDTEEGWYVSMTYILSGFGKPYDESGRVVNYYICNVGPNGLMEFKKSADDICRYYNGDSSDINFPGMGAGESRLLVNRAQQAISEAARQYNQKTVRIGKNTFGSAISFGGEEGRCSDFMSPQDCNLLFNVCDPVICPASRCDLGGEFRVDNVMQTGIIGSLALCLPNIKEGIFIPICLSGVHSGIENYLSILNSTNACLKESLETGRNIGICDEIKSIYLCEFFWKQATPLINVIIPRTIESFFSQGIRGGGEYLTVQSAWDNTNAAIDYFKNEYAINSMQAFTSRSTEEIGSDICKSFVSVRYPTSQNYFDSLIEPDSPVQYSAWFSEDILTTATIPSTSHYKVYYHIYSGKDQGAYYAVYLKDLPESNFIYSTTNYIVDSGYIARGSQIDEARDFTAVSGYKQLCISVNGQEQCGFGKVSTSYLVNSLTDAYAQEQLQTNIKSEKQCISGTPSALSVFQPDIQSGVEKILNPELYNHGIIRICSTENPGKKVLLTGEYDTTASTYDRWKEVGYCDDQTIKCWLDTTSVKNVIQDKGIENQALEEIDINILGGKSLIDEDTSRTDLSKIDEQIDNLQKQITSADTISTIDSKISPIKERLSEISNLASSNKNRARATYNLGKLYKTIAEILLDFITKNTGSSSTNTPSETETPQNETSNSKEDTSKKPLGILGTGFTLKNNKIYLNGEYTNYDLQLAENGYLILNLQPPTKRVGSIINGEISFTVQDSEIENIKDLKNYKLENGEFIKK